MRPSERLSRHSGYTILELVIVLAILIILGSVIVPTLANYYGNSRQVAASDLIRQRVVEGRAKAMEQGIWYRLAINQDKKRIRLAPDNQNFSSSSPSPDSSPAPNAQVIEDKLDGKVTAEVSFDPNDPRSSNNSDDWLTVMTIGPEGICREQYNTTVTVKESNFQPLLIQVRGLVGSAAIVPPPNGGKK